MECDNTSGRGEAGGKATFDSETMKESSNSNTPDFFPGPSVTSNDEPWPCPTSPKPTTSHANNKGRNPTAGVNNNNASAHTSRRIFTNEFKLNVLEAFNTDPECIGNQRATARKFGIHRRQVQKWLQQPQANTKDESCDDLLQPPSPEVANGRNIRSSSEKAKKELQSLGSECSTPTEPPLYDDLSKLSQKDMALSLNLSMNYNNPQHLNPLSLLHLQAPRTSPPPFYNNGNKAPTNGNGPINRNGGSPANMSNSSSSGTSGSQPQMPFNETLDIVDEIAYMYPQEDFNLLRQALIRNEVTFTKVKKAHRQKPRSEPVNNRASYVSLPSESPSKPNTYSASAQQAFEFFRQQSDYVKLLQQAGVNLPFANDMHPFSDIHNQKYQWFQNPDLMTSAGFGIPTAASKKQGGNHTFISPRPPSNSKPKTVAAALAASRLSPTPALKYSTNELNSKPRQSQQRKRQPKATKTSPAEIPDEEFIDPTSMLEVTSAAVEENGVDLSNHSHTHANANGFSYGNHSLLQTQYAHRSPPDRGDSDSELTKYLALEAYATDPDIAGDARALARKFGLNVRVVMKWIKEGNFKAGNSTNSIRVNGDSGNKHQEVYKNTNGNGSLLDMSMLKSLNKVNEHSTMQLKFANLCSNEDLKRKPYAETDDSFRSASSLKNALVTSGSSTNKRKNSKPNQICDFIQDDCYNDGPVDMIVPMKKRRLSAHE